MFRKSLLFSYILLLGGISLSLILPALFTRKYELFVQIFMVFSTMTVYIFVIWKRIQKSLFFLQHTMKKIGDNDPTISIADKHTIQRMADIRYFDLKKLVKFTNTLLLNQHTILETAFKDRDFIDKSRKLRDAIIDLNQLIVTGKGIKVLLQHLLTTAINIISDCDAGIVYQVTYTDRTLKPAAFSGYRKEDLNKEEFTLEETYLYQYGKLKDSNPLIIRNRRQIDRKHNTPEDIEKYKRAGFYNYNAILTAPIIVDDDLYGIVSLNSKNAQGFNDDDVQLLKYFTSEMGVVIKNSFLIQKALYLSKYDSLTGVHNRHFFEEVAHIILHDAARYKRSIHIVLFDLDNFKTINDTYGHETGDEVLRVFAKTVSSSIRESDIFARFGGDEFTALFHDCDRNNLNVRIRAIIEKLEKTPVIIEDKEYFIKYSYGIAGFPEDATRYEDLLHLADLNMYQHKSRNKEDTED